jgi:hypothetical protein
MISPTASSTSKWSTSISSRLAATLNASPDDEPSLRELVGAFPNDNDNATFDHLAVSVPMTSKKGFFGVSRDNHRWSSLATDGRRSNIRVRPHTASPSSTSSSTQGARHRRGSSVPSSTTPRVVTAMMGLPAAAPLHSHVLRGAALGESARWNRNVAPADGAPPIVDANDIVAPPPPPLIVTSSSLTIPSRRPLSATSRTTTSTYNPNSTRGQRALIRQRWTSSTSGSQIAQHRQRSNNAASIAHQVATQRSIATQHIALRPTHHNVLTPASSTTRTTISKNKQNGNSNHTSNGVDTHMIHGNGNGNNGVGPWSDMDSVISTTVHSMSTNHTTNRSRGTAMMPMSSSTGASPSNHTWTAHADTTFANFRSSYRADVDARQSRLQRILDNTTNGDITANNNEGSEIESEYPDGSPRPIILHHTVPSSALPLRMINTPVVPTTYQLQLPIQAAAPMTFSFPSTSSVPIAALSSFSVSLSGYDHTITPSLSISTGVTISTQLSPATASVATTKIPTPPTSSPRTTTPLSIRVATPPGMHAHVAPVPPLPTPALAGIPFGHRSIANTPVPPSATATMNGGLPSPSPPLMSSVQHRISHSFALQSPTLIASPLPPPLTPIPIPGDSPSDLIATIPSPLLAIMDVPSPSSDTSSPHHNNNDNNLDSASFLPSPALPSQRRQHQFRSSIASSPQVVVSPSVSTIPHASPPLIHPAYYYNTSSLSMLSSPGSRVTSITPSLPVTQLSINTNGNDIDNSTNTTNGYFGGASSKRSASRATVAASGLTARRAYKQRSGSTTAMRPQSSLQRPLSSSMSNDGRPATSLSSNQYGHRRNGQVAHHNGRSSSHASYTDIEDDSDNEKSREERNHLEHRASRLAQRILRMQHESDAIAAQQEHLSAQHTENNDNAEYEPILEGSGSNGDDDEYPFISVATDTNGTDGNSTARSVIAPPLFDHDDLDDNTHQSVVAQPTTEAAAPSTAKRPLSAVSVTSKNLPSRSKVPIISGVPMPSSSVVPSHVPDFAFTITTPRDARELVSYSISCIILSYCLLSANTRQMCCI